jgi:hypothetical protein
MKESVYLIIALWCAFVAVAVSWREIQRLRKQRDQAVTTAQKIGARLQEAVTTAEVAATTAQEAVTTAQEAVTTAQEVQDMTERAVIAGEESQEIARIAIQTTKSVVTALEEIKSSLQEIVTPTGEIPPEDVFSLVNMISATITQLTAEKQTLQGYLDQLQDTLDQLEEKRRNSGHFNYGPEDRRGIVEHYYRARAAGEVENMAGWATSNYHISERTLRNYCQEFPEAET